MTLLSRAAIAVLMLFAALPASAQDRSPQGRWALHAGGRTLLILELSRTGDEIGFWVGSLTEPARIRWTSGSIGFGFDGVQGPVVARAMRRARPMSGGVSIDLIDDVPGQPDTFHFNVGADGTGALSVDGSPLPPLLLAPAEPGETVAAAGWDPARHYVADRP